MHQVPGRRKCWAAAYSRCGAQALLEERTRFLTGIGRPSVLMLMRSAAARHDDYSYTKLSLLSPQSASNSLQVLVAAVGSVLQAAPAVIDVVQGSELQEQQHTWRRRQQQAALDHSVVWIRVLQSYRPSCCRGAPGNRQCRRSRERQVARPEPLTLRGTVGPTIARTRLCSAAILCGARRFSGAMGCSCN